MCFAMLGLSLFLIKVAVLLAESDLKKPFVILGFIEESQIFDCFHHCSFYMRISDQKRICSIEVYSF